MIFFTKKSWKNRGIFGIYNPDTTRGAPNIPVADCSRDICFTKERPGFSAGKCTDLRRRSAVRHVRLQPEHRVRDRRDADAVQFEPLVETRIHSDQSHENGRKCSRCSVEFVN